MSIPTVNLDVLRTLHRIHKQLTDLKDRRDRGPRQVHAHEAGVKLREEDLARVRDELKTARKNIDQKQLQMKTNEQKIKDIGTKLNMAATNKEYQILKDQIAADKMANSVLEDEILEMMDQLDAFGPKIFEAEKLLKTMQEKLAAAHAEVKQQASLIQGDIERLEGELVHLESELPDGIREDYLRPRAGPRRGRLGRGGGGRLQRLLPAGAREFAGEHPHVASQLLPLLRKVAVFWRGEVGSRCT